MASLSAQLAIPHGEDLRTTRRRAVNFRGFVRETAARLVTVEVQNLSTDGCNFQSDEAFETATVVWLKIAGIGARQARIVWHRGGAYGCEFLAPMRSEVIEDICTAERRRLLEANRAVSHGFGRAAV